MMATGVASAAFGLEGFLLPNTFIDGGATGIALLITAYSGWPLGAWLILVNLPFAFMAYHMIGKEFALKTIIGITALALLGKAGLHLLVKTNITAGIKANNIAAGITAAAAYVSTGIVLAGALSGENSGGDFTVTALFLLIAVGTLWTVTYVFRFLTGYDDARQIAQGIFGRPRKALMI